ncbi:phytanoyl-CoA dioxygenase family protein [Falsiroseomonas ponticola]|uniref:phytanoyl-CoA dioxygenase family protein n=1 Tax=Falsiroseomonas ponticola TaxID=2786951 RepID=UPI00193354F4|nr:phytanoyl-CoA dioxygenase family protein [Roseomonas ponticola]
MLIRPSDALLPLDEVARARFLRDGFVAVPGVVPPAELAEIRALYDALFDTRAGWERGDFFDMLDPADRPEQPRLTQLAWPSRHAPWLAHTQMRANAQALAAALLPAADLVWEFAICKPPRIGAATPWHQDEASFTIGTPYRMAVSCWIALQDVDEAMGCMRYVPGSHHGPLLAHESVGGDPRAHALAAVAPDLRRVESVRLRAGDAVLHHSRVLHGAGPNTSSAPRRALTLEFAVRDRAQLIRRDFAWNRGKWTARDAREAASLPLAERLRRGLRRTRMRLGW